MARYNVYGMSCAACAGRVEKAVGSVNGVSVCHVSLLTNSMRVEGTCTTEDVIRAVVNAGYRAELSDGKAKETPREINKSIINLAISFLFLFALLYFSMGHAMLGFPLPALLSGSLAISVFEGMLALFISIINRGLFIRGFKGAVKLSPNMDTLVSLGSASAFLYSFVLTVRVGLGVTEAFDKLCYESCAMILTLVSLGKLLEKISKGKTASAIDALAKLAPDTLKVERNGEEVLIPVSELKVGDVFTVRPGESVPGDGDIIFGDTSIDESSLTGESIPVYKMEGDRVCQGTINLTGFIKCRTVRVGEDTLLSSIIRTVKEASEGKAPISRTADKISSVFVPSVLLISLITFTVWMIVGDGFAYSLSRAITVLVISCPCALGLATPVAVMVGSGIAAKHGILFRTAEALENTAKVNCLVFDKTGTLTLGQCEVSSVETDDEEMLLRVAYSLEKQSTHPLAAAICNYANERNINPFGVSDFREKGGLGVCAELDGITCHGGSYKYVSLYMPLKKEVDDKAKELSLKGETPIFFAHGGKYLGCIGVSDKIRKDSRASVLALDSMGIDTLMLSGDNECTAKAYALRIGIKNVIAEVLPNDKAKEIEKQKKDGCIAMVGDGINDAPALASADIGMAIGAGCDIAIDSADVVLIKNSPLDAVKAIKISRKVLRVIKENLFFALLYNTLCIPLAAGMFVRLFGWELQPMYGAAAMSLSSVTVVLNALRLNLYNFNDKNTKEKNVMKNVKTYKIEGMMCTHCSARVKAAIENVEGVISCDVSHERGDAKVTFDKAPNDSKIISAVTEAGYKVK